MYCLDTNIVIDIFRGDVKLKQRLEFIQRLGIEVSITFLSVAELYKGVYLSARKDESLLLVEDFLKNVISLNLSMKSCDLFGMDYGELKKKGKIVPEVDLLIASIAKAEGRIFVTRNEKHFKEIPDLKVEVW